MFLVDTTEGRIVPDEEIKHGLAARQPYAQWIRENQVTLDMLPEPPRWHPTDFESHVTAPARLRLHGRRSEVHPHAHGHQWPGAVGSMGCDTPLACLSDKPQPLFNYFKQLFAQVTNPPIDPIREELVMSPTSFIGTERNILDETPQHCHTLKLASHPDELRSGKAAPRFLGRLLWPPRCRRSILAEGGEKELDRALDGLCRRASLAIKSGYTLLILSDRGIDEEYAPIPSLLALTAVHNHLVREKTRTQVALIVESGEPREVMHFALLIGYGASAVNPYLAVETLEQMQRRGWFPAGVTFESALKNYKKAINKGLLKVFSKMGISTLQSYRGAQVFESIGLNKSLVDKYFTGTASRIEGVGLDVIAREAKMKHDYAFRPLTEADTELAVGGNYHYRPMASITCSIRKPSASSSTPCGRRATTTFKEYAALVDDQSRHLCTLRGLMEFKTAGGPFRSKRSSRPRRSSSASPPAPCRSAPSARKRTRRWPSP